MEASNTSYRHGNRSTSGRLFGDRERHYHEYKHPTTAILMVVRSWEATPSRSVAKNLTSLQHPPCLCQENAYSLPPPPSFFPHRFHCSISFFDRTNRFFVPIGTDTYHVVYSILISSTRSKNGIGTCFFYPFLFTLS